MTESLQRKLGVRGPQGAPTKERITIRLSRDVVERFRATGDGWQTRVDEALQDWLKSHEVSASLRSAALIVRCRRRLVTPLGAGFAVDETYVSTYDPTP